MTEFIELSYT